MPSTLFPEPYRSQWYPHTKKSCYLNHAAISPLSVPVMKELNQYLDERHLSRIENFFDFQPKLQATRERFAQMLKTTADRIAFVPNTSSGLNILATSYPWQPGDRILLNNLEFPTNVYPFLNLKRLGVKVDFVEHRDYRLHLEDFEAALTPQTKLLSISHVQFLSGQRMDLKALGQLCREQGVVFSVDSIQSLGATDLDVNDCQIDFLACGSHKWMMAPAGIGILYLSPALQEQLTPAQASWLSVEDEWNLLDYQLTFKDSAARFETGTMNFIGIAGFYAALGAFSEVGQERITRQVLDLSTQLWQGLAELGFKLLTPEAETERLGIVTALIEDADSLYQTLFAKGIEAAAREGKYFRISPHFYNTAEEIAHFLEALRQAM